MRKDPSSFAAVTDLIQSKGQHTLRMVQKATTEKLINKILKAYTSDLAWSMPFVLMLLLLFRETTKDHSNCNGGVAKWLLVYFSADIIYVNLKLFKICILKRDYTMRSYYLYWFTIGLFYYTL